MEKIPSLIKENIGKVMVGQENTVNLLLAASLAGGDVLIEDVHGMGKTVLARSLAKSVNAGFGRIQFTPDLLPSDVTGLNFFDQKKGEFVSVSYTHLTRPIRSWSWLTGRWVR